ncbi:MAG: PucR family transcriptional regulator [Christensenellales bacterium]|jgi:sugar diacid utilization regulator|nr:hypothetical protein [Clostridiales bacterium]
MNAWQKLKLDAYLSRLDTPFFIYDAHGVQVYGHKLREIPPANLKPGQFLVQNGLMYLGLEGGALILCKDSAYAHDALLLAVPTVEKLLTKAHPEDARRNALQLLLSSDISQDERLALCADFATDLSYQVMLFTLHGGSPADIKVLESIFPLEKNDCFLALSPKTAVFIKVIDEQDPWDMQELALAMLETAQVEEGMTLKAGLGSRVDSPAKWHQSLKEARAALEVGPAFRKKDLVFCYDSLWFERFLSEIPLHIAQKYSSFFSDKKITRALNNSMIETVNTYLDAGMNLTEAARRLYIHRNTLAYRLDKILSLTGLDIRNFNDAMTFKLFYELSLRAKEVAPTKGEPQ